MGIVKMNVAKNLESTASKMLFMDVPKDGMLYARFLPAVDGSNGEIWYLAESHFRLKDEEGKGIAVACNKRHGDGDCYLCDLTDLLANSDDKNEVAIGKGKESSKANKSWYAQVVLATKTGVDDDGVPIFEYGEEIKLLRLPKTGATAVNDIMTMQKEAGEPFFNDFDKGKLVVVKRQDTGEAFTKYSAMAAGVPVPLDVVFPMWEKKYIPDADTMWVKLDPRIMSCDEQKATATRTYPELSWGEITKELGR